MTSCMRHLRRAATTPRSAVGLQHVFEPHPLLVEVQVDVPARTVAVLQNDQLRRAVHVRCTVVHLMTIEPEHDIRELLHGPKGAEVVELGPRILAVSHQERQMARHQDAHISRHGESLQRARRDGHILLERPRSARERLDRIDDDEIHVHVSVRIALEPRKLIRSYRRQSGQRLLDECTRPSKLGAALIIERAAADVVEPHTRFDRERPLGDSLWLHFTGPERHAGAGLHGTQSNREREGRLPGGNLSAERDEVATPHPATERVVDTGKAGGNRVVTSRAAGDHADSTSEPVAIAGARHTWLATSRSTSCSSATAAWSSCGVVTSMTVLSAVSSIDRSTDVVASTSFANDCRSATGRARDANQARAPFARVIRTP